jgi:2-dehydro-3-deoxygluconokinase
MRIVCVGEVMGELRRSAHSFVVGFAGDTFNTAVYLRRSLGMDPRHQVAYLTRVGCDPLSDGFLELADHEGIALAGIVRDPTRNLGIYSVQTDESGERSFAYWRNQSAARALFDDPTDLTLLDQADIVFLSGISLAILSPASRRSVLDHIAALRKKGLRFAFDSNYRPKLWEDVATARKTIACAWSLTDIALPSVDDEMALFGDADAAAVLDRLRGLGCKDGALKRGADGSLPIDPAVAAPNSLAKAARVIDTTAAGDSFNGAWLAAYVCGSDQQICMTQGHRLAAYVIGRPGAIVDMSAFQGIA